MTRVAVQYEASVSTAHESRARVRARHARAVKLLVSGTVHVHVQLDSQRTHMHCTIIH